VYEYVNIPFDLIEQYQVDNNLTMDIRAYCVNYPIFLGLENWANILYAIPNEEFSLFTKWMVTQVFSKDKGRILWNIRGRELAIIDPGAYHLGNTDGIAYVKCMLFLPYGNVKIVDARAAGLSYRIFTKPPTSESIPGFDVSKLA
jgi:hypothetical protein